MRQTVKYRWACLVILSVCWPMPAWAQFGGGSRNDSAPQTVSATGTQVLRTQPVAYRLLVELTGKGKTLEEALANLEDRQKAARLQLQQLQADMESVTFSAPRLATPGGNQMERMEALLTQRLAAGADIPPGLKVPKSSAVSATLTAEWPLPAEDSIRLLLTAQKIQKQVEAEDLAGLQDNKQASPEEAELAEEMQAFGDSYGNESPALGKPHFLYIARITDQQRADAFAHAFGKAKEQARMLANAAEAKLGSLVSLGGTGQSQTDWSGTNMDYEMIQYIQALTGASRNLPDGESQNQVTGMTPDTLHFQFHIRASFVLLQAADSSP